MDKNSTFIYSLIDPRSGEDRYIGKSNDPNKRFREGHLVDKTNTYKTNWIKSLLKKGLSPQLNIVDKVSINEWKFWEQHYISLYKSWGFKLTNGTEGGDGGDTSHSPNWLERNKKIGEKLKISKLGHFVSEETKLKQSLRKINTKQSKEVLKKRSLRIKGSALLECPKCKLYCNPESIKHQKTCGKINASFVKRRGRAVVKLDRDYNLIAQFNNCAHANRITGVNVFYMCRYKKNDSEGSIWMYKHEYQNFKDNG